MPASHVIAPVDAGDVDGDGLAGESWRCVTGVKEPVASLTAEAGIVVFASHRRRVDGRDLGSGR
jgi:hypothetical protein